MFEIIFKEFGCFSPFVEISLFEYLFHKNTLLENI